MKTLFWDNEDMTTVSSDAACYDTVKDFIDEVNIVAKYVLKKEVQLKVEKTGSFFRAVLQEV